MADLSPEAQTLLMVVQIVDWGRLAPSTACRVGACPIPALITLPRIASSIVKLDPVRSMQDLMAWEASCGALREESDPQNCVMGVRA